MTDLFDPIQYETGTPIRTFSIIDSTADSNGYIVRLSIDLDSGYELEDVKMRITFEDMAGYETEDLHEGVKYALGFFVSH
jgi:hypothetical protein